MTHEQLIDEVLKLRKQYLKDLDSGMGVDNPNYELIAEGALRTCDYVLDLLQYTGKRY